MTLHVVFMGSPAFAVPTLAGIVAAGHDVVAVYSQPPRTAGRGLEARPSPVQQLAEKLHLRVETPVNFKEPAEQQRFGAHAADVAVVAAYGLILPKAILDAPRHGCFNLHPSRLPRWRGAAPIQRTIMAGDRETAVMVMRMEEGLDSGPICLSEAIALSPGTTAGELHDQAAQLGADLILRALDALELNTLTCLPQPAEGIVYAQKVLKSETGIDWRRSAGEIVNHIHGLSPAPGAWFEISEHGKAERWKVLHAEEAEGHGSPGLVLLEPLTIACGQGAVRPLVMQRPGKLALAAAEVLRGRAIAPGTVLRGRPTS